MSYSKNPVQTHIIHPDDLSFSYRALYLLTMVSDFVLYFPPISSSPTSSPAVSFLVLPPFPHFNVFPLLPPIEFGLGRLRACLWEEHAFFAPANKPLLVPPELRQRAEHRIDQVATES